MALALFAFSGVASAHSDPSCDRWSSDHERALKRTDWGWLEEHARHHHHQHGYRVPHHLVFLTQPSSQGVAGQDLDRDPLLVAVGKHGRPVLRPLAEVTVGAYSDAACTVRASGKLSVSMATWPARVGFVALKSVIETASGDIYLRVAAKGVAAACSTKIRMAPAAADHLMLLAGDGQSGAPGSVLPIAAKVRVVDAYGNGVSGVALSFASSSGGGSAQPSSATSDAQGAASSSLKLGAAAGTQTWSVGRSSGRLKGSPATLTLTATAISSGAAVLALSGPSAQGAGACSAAFVVSARNRSGQLVNQPNGLAISLAGLGAARVYADTACSQSLAAVAIARGASSASFYLRDTRAETLSLVASAQGVGSSPLLTAVVSAGPAALLAFDAQPSAQSVAGQILESQPTVRVLDAYGNAASSGSHAVELGLASDAACAAGVSGLSGQAVSSSQGLATFVDVSVSAAGAFYLRAQASGLAQACSAAVVISPAGPARIVILSGDGQSGVVGTALADAVRVRVTDAFDNAVAGAELAFASSAGSVSPAEAQSDDQGQASFSVTLPTAPGSSVLVINSQWGDNPASAQAYATAVAGAPASLAVSGPNAISAGQCSSFAISFADSYGNAAVPGSLVLGLSGAAYADAGCSQSISQLEVAAGMGSPQFYFASTAAGVASISVDGFAAGLNSVSLSASVSAAAAASLVVVSQPASQAAAGESLQASFGLRDAYGNVSESGASVHLSAYTDAACAVPVGGLDATVAASDGLAQFALTYAQASVIYLGASSTGLASACTSAVSISAAAPSQLALVSGDAQSAVAGQELSQALVVHVADAYGNAVGGAAVSFAVTSGSGQLSATSVLSSATGQAQAQLTVGLGANEVTASIVGVSVVFHATGTARPAVALALSGPTATAAGECVGAYTVQLLDSNQSATTSDEAVSVALSGAGFYADAACSQGIQAVQIAAGQGAAQAYVSHAAAESLMLVAQATGLGSSSVALAVSPAPASRLVYAIQPSSSATTGQAFAAQPVIGIYDAYGNLVSAYASAVTLSAHTDALCSSPAQGALSAASVNAQNGMVTYAGVSFDSAATIYLKASSGALAPACSQAVAVAAALPSMVLAAGTAHTCALRDGNVKCWGFNNSGTLGNGGNTNASTPQQVTGFVSGAFAMGAGGQHSCASNASGTYCWGLGTAGQLGNGLASNSNVPVVVSGLSGTVAQIVGGDTHTCVLVGGAVKCWGSNELGQLGNGSFASSAVPVDVQGLPAPVQSIAAASLSTCAVLVDGRAYCWGDNDFGQLGNGGTQSSAVPVELVGLPGTVTSIAPGIQNTCALISGAVYCWGRNNMGQLGDGTFSDSLTPVQVSGMGTGVTSLLSGGQNFSCASVSGGAVKCWGQNTRGQLGDNRVSGTTSNIPVQVVGLTSGYQVLKAGYIHACASNGSTIQCWGSGSSGQLGNGQNAQSNVPVTVVGYP